MENIVIIKDNEKVSKGIRTYIGINDTYLKDHGCFKNQINNCLVEKYELRDIFKLSDQIETMLSEIYRLNKERIERNFEFLKQADSISKLKELSENIVLQYYDILNKKYSLKDDGKAKINAELKKTRDDINNKFDVFATILIKKIIEKYYINKLSQLDISKIVELENFRLKNIDVEYILNKIGEKFDEISIKNGVKSLSLKIVLNIIDKIYDKTQNHLCWMNCKNATPNNCEKIKDKYKKNINQYDFITNGYQVISDEGVETFVVTKCKNYEEEKKKELTVRETRRIKHLKDNIMMEYFGVDSVKEANAIQKHMINTGQIKKIK